MTARDLAAWFASALTWALVATHVVAPIVRAVIQGGRP